MEKELRGRGVDLCFYTEPHLKEEDKQKFKEAMLLRGYLKHFESTHFEFFPEEEDVMIIRVWCPEALFMIKPSDSPKFYEDFFDEVFEFVKKLLNFADYKLKGYSFNLVHRISHTEEDLIPMPTINIEDKQLD